MSARTDPHIFEIIEFLQPFITKKVYLLCDLERQEQVRYAYDRPAFDKRHAGHTWCHDTPTECGCPCHWTQDEIAFKLIEVYPTLGDPPPVIGTWFGSYMGRQKTEAKRLRSLADGRDAMVERVIAALIGP